MEFKAILNWIKSVKASKNTPEKEGATSASTKKDALDNLIYGMTNDTQKGEGILTKKTINH